MDASAFDDALGKTLRLCRLAADLDLPIAEMLEHVEEAIDASASIVVSPRVNAHLEDLREILAAVADVAAIGCGLADEAPGVPPQPPRTAPPERSFPLPANLREA